MGCKIKILDEAWNTGVDAFDKSFSVTGDVNESLRYAIYQINDKHPDVDFEIDSFTSPIVEAMKQEGLIKETYVFTDGKKTKSDNVKNKVKSIVEKFKKLNKSGQEVLARKIYDKIDEQGLLKEGDIQDLYSGMIGLPSMTAIEKGDFIQEASKAKKDHAEAEQKLIDAMSDIHELQEKGELTPEQEKEWGEKLDTLNKDAKAKLNLINRKKQELTQAISDRRFWELTGVDMMQMNLLSPVTLAANITGMAFDTFLRLPKNIISSAIRIGATYKSTGNLNLKQSVSRTAGAASSIKDATSKLKEAGLYGNAGQVDGLPRYDHLNAVSAWKRLFSDNGENKIVNSLAFVFRLSPDFIKRGLAAPDAFVHELLFGAELNRIADSKGLKGIDRQIFMINPDEKYFEQAKKIADEGTLRTDTKISKLFAVDPYKMYDKLTQEYKLDPYTARTLTFISYFGIKNLAPFVKTPVNLIKLSARYIVPGLEAGLMYSEYKKETDPIEKQRIIADGIGRMAVGLWVQKATILTLIAGGVSAGFKDDDEQVQDAIYKKLGGTNRLNYSAFMRALSGQSPEWKEGDQSIELRSLGVLGLIVGAHAHAFNKYGKEENKEEGTSIIPDIAREAKATITSALDNTFLAGANQAIDVFASDDDNKFNQYQMNALAFLFTGIEPSTIQKLSTSKEENVKRTYDKTVGLDINIANMLGYKFLFNALDTNKDMKNKVFGVSENEKESLKTKDKYFFDNYLGRILHSEMSVFKGKEIENTPISKLLDASKEQPKENRSELFPSAVGATQKIGQGHNSFTVDLTPEQHEYLMRKASMMRMVMATPYINSEKFKKDSHALKEQTLKLLYKQGLDLAKQQLAAKFSGKFVVSHKTDTETLEEAKINERYFSSNARYLD